MALSTRSLRPSLGPDPVVALEQQKQQRAQLDKEIALGEQRALAELRKPWIARRLQLAGEIAADGAATRAAEAKIQSTKKAFEAAKAEYEHQVQSQIQRNCVRQREQKEIESKLIETAPANIAAASAAWEAKRDEAIGRESTREVGDGAYESNAPAVRQFVPAAQQAASLIRDLRLTAVDAAEAEKEIARIVKGIPKLDSVLTPKPVKTERRQPVAENFVRRIV